MENARLQIVEDIDKGPSKILAEEQVELIVKEVSQEAGGPSDIQVKIQEEGGRQYAVEISVVGVDEWVCAKKVGKKVIPTLRKVKKTVLRRIRKQKKFRFTVKNDSGTSGKFHRESLSFKQLWKGGY